MPDEFEQELLTDISAAEAFGEHELAAEWRAELHSYRAAKEQAQQDDAVWEGSTSDVRRARLDRLRSELF